MLLPFPQKNPHSVRNELNDFPLLSLSGPFNICCQHIKHVALKPKLPEVSHPMRALCHKRLLPVIQNLPHLRPVNLFPDTLPFNSLLLQYPMLPPLKETLEFPSHVSLLKHIPLECQHTEPGFFEVVQCDKTIKLLA